VFTLHTDNEPAQDNFGEKTLARSCFVVVLPHYLEALGLKSLTSERDMASLFPELITVMDIMLSKSESLPSIRKKQVFLFGESLGGYLGIALALRRPEVMAISEISGGIPTGYPIERASPMAVLISHGVDDKLVPEQEAEKLQEFCMQHHFRCEKDIYPASGHYFSQAIKLQCIARTVDFFRAVNPSLLDGLAPSSKLESAHVR